MPLVGSSSSSSLSAFVPELNSAKHQRKVTACDRQPGSLELPATVTAAAEFGSDCASGSEHQLLSQEYPQQSNPNPHISGAALNLQSQASLGTSSSPSSAFHSPETHHSSVCTESRTDRLPQTLLGMLGSQRRPSGSLVIPMHAFHNSQEQQQQTCDLYSDGPPQAMLGVLSIQRRHPLFQKVELPNCNGNPELQQEQQQPMCNVCRADSPAQAVLHLPYPQRNHASLPSCGMLQGCVCSSEQQQQRQSQHHHYHHRHQQLMQGQMPACHVTAANSVQFSEPDYSSQPMQDLQTCRVSHA